MLNVTDRDNDLNLTEDDSAAAAATDHPPHPLTSDFLLQSPSIVPPDAVDIVFNRTIRIVVLVAEILAGTIGGACVCAWLWRNRRRRSRISVIILNVTATDLLVICFACLMQLIWEAVDRNWMAGDAMCRILKWGQSFAMMSSNNMLVVLSVDRHQAIRAPLKEPFSVMKMVALGYGIGALLSTPQLAVFRQNFVTAEGMFKNKTVCESIFRDTPPWFRQFYLTSISLVVFYLPLMVIVTCYVRIYLKISEKTAESKQSTANPKKSQRPGKVMLHSTRSKSLPKAKAKTLKMTVVIVGAFIVFGLPYHVLEMLLSFGLHSLVPPTTMAIVGAMAVANSAVNPFIFLLFSGTDGCLRWITARRSVTGDVCRDNQELRGSCAPSESRTPAVCLLRSPGGGSYDGGGGGGAGGDTNRMRGNKEPVTMVTTICGPDGK